MLEATKSNYIIIEGEDKSKEYNLDILFQFIMVPYNIEKKLNLSKLYYNGDWNHNKA